jgi:hypothetical protein
VAVEGRAVRWAKGNPMRAIMSVAGVGLLVGALVGVWAGFTIEQNRVHKDVSKLKAQLAGHTRTTTPHAKPKVGSGSGLLAVKRIGTVTATSAGTITVATKQHGSLSLHLIGSTHVDQAATGRTSDISAGSRVLVAKHARALLVLPTGRTIGRKITKVANGVASVTKIGGVATFKLSNVQSVYTTSPATASDIKTGSHVLAWLQPSGKGTPNAIEIIILPAGSAFG